MARAFPAACPGLPSPRHLPGRRHTERQRKRAEGRGGILARGRAGHGEPTPSNQGGERTLRTRFLDHAVQDSNAGVPTQLGTQRPVCGVQEEHLVWEDEHNRA